MQAAKTYRNEIFIKKVDEADLKASPVFPTRGGKKFFAGKRGESL